MKIATPLFLALSLLALSLLATTATAEDASKWRGEPKVAEGRSVAAVGWEDVKGGLHLRVTTPFRKEKGFRVTGAVCALDMKGKNTITSLTPVLLEKNQDSAKVGPEGHCIWFNFLTNGHIDGFDFTTAARHLSFSIKVDGKLLSTDAIHLGAAGNHPAKNPVILER